MSLFLIPEEDEAGTVWGAGLAPEWSAELKDSRQDIYTLEDGQASECTLVTFGDVRGMKLRPVLARHQTSTLPIGGR